MSVKFELVKFEEAQDFVLSLPKPAMKKVLDNVHRIAEGERKPNCLRNWKVQVKWNSSYLTR